MTTPELSATSVGVDTARTAGEAVVSVVAPTGARPGPPRRDRDLS